MKILLFFFDYLLLLVGVLVGLAFFTLVERKIMGYVHFRKGPSKLFYFGLFQPFSDAIKLFSKENLKGYKFKYMIFFCGPIIGLFLMFILWCIYCGVFGIYGSFFSLLYVFAFLSLGVYFLLFCGWGSNTKYSLLGSYRGVSQTISYEVSMIFFVLVLVYYICFYDFGFLYMYQFGYWFSFISFFLFLGWLYVCLAELNRTPFDFSEGESELVSGFNVDYSGGLFSFIFICEYGMIIFLSFFSISVFLGSSNFFLKLVIFCFFIVLVRCSYPRYRYDMLMYSAWKIFLPFSLSFLVMFSIF